MKIQSKLISLFMILLLLILIVVNYALNISGPAIKAEAEEKQMIEQFDFYKRFEEIAKQCIKERKGKSVSSNIDFYSGFVYSMLNIPQELVSLLFVTARIVGWLAHNIEDKCYCDKIVRPATKYVGDTKKFVKIEER